jgi:hypothetical protein
VPDRYLSPEQVCDLIPGMTKVSLQELRKKGRGPAYRKPTPRLVVYREDDVLAWVEQSRVDTRDQP